MIDQAYGKAKKLLTEHSDTLDKIAKVLMDKETIEAEEFARIMKESGLDKPAQL